MAEGSRDGETYEVTSSDLEGRNIRQVTADVNLGFEADAASFWVVCAAGAGIIILSVVISTDAILRQSPKDILLD